MNNMNYLIWIILGAWIALSPFILGGATTVVTYNNVLIGVAIIFLAIWKKFVQGK